MAPIVSSAERRRRSVGPTSRRGGDSHPARGTAGVGLDRRAERPSGDLGWPVARTSEPAIDDIGLERLRGVLRAGPIEDAPAARRTPRWQTPALTLQSEPGEEPILYAAIHVAPAPCSVSMRRRRLWRNSSRESGPAALAYRHGTGWPERHGSRRTGSVPRRLRLSCQCLACCQRGVRRAAGASSMGASPKNATPAFEADIIDAGSEVLQPATKVPEGRSARRSRPTPAVPELGANRRHDSTSAQPIAGRRCRTRDDRAMTARPEILDVARRIGPVRNTQAPHTVPQCVCVAR